MVDKIRKPVPRLTDADKARVEQETTWSTRLVAVWRVVLGKVGEDFDRASSIDPTCYVLDHADWVWACESIMECETDPIAKVEASLEWVNRGPSSGPSKPAAVR